jgi:hypothetical protein
MKSCHFDPTGMSCSASVHPLITCPTPNVAGPALVGAVKFRAVDESAPVVTHNLVARGGLRSVARFQNLVLQTAGKVTTPSFALLAARNASPSVLFAAAASCIFSCCSLRPRSAPREHGLRFFFRQTRLTAGHGVLQSLGHQIPVHFHRLLFQAAPRLFPDVHSQCVAELFFSRCKGSRRRAFRRCRSRSFRRSFRSCGCRSRWSRCRRSACWRSLLGIAISGQHHPCGQ